MSDEAFERKFERDKAALVDLGIPLRFVHGDEGTEDGYVVDREETYLPALELDAEELATLYIAGDGLLSQAEFPYHRDLERALNKIALRVEPERIARARTAARRILLNHPVQPRTPGLDETLELVSHAVAERRRLRLVYHALYSGETSEREVDPYGLRCWQGRWALVGYCHRREDVRLFSLHRMRQVALVEGAAPFEVPADFSVTAWQMQPAWRYRIHPAMCVRLEYDPQRAWLVDEQLGSRVGEAADGWVTFDVEVTNVDAFIEWALRQGPHVRVVSPADVRGRIIATLEAVVGSGTGGRT